MTLFQLTALFLTLVGVAGWVNARFLKLPHGVAMLAAGLVAAGGLAALEAAGVTGAESLATRIDFPETVVGYMLAFLLFAGAMQVDLGELRRRNLAVWTLATGGVLASTALVGGGVWLAARLLGVSLPLTWALVFGALISPTDPVAVLATVKGGRLSDGLRAVLQGEALFNDGVGIVVFLALLALASGGAADPGAAALSVLVKAGGGLVFGLAAGWLVVKAMHAIDDYASEIMLSLALAVGVYAAAEALHMSGAIAVVAAGLLLGGQDAKSAMSETVERYLKNFWTLVDEILNALLFFLLGLVLLSVPFDPRFAGLWAAAIILVLAVRFAVVLPWGAWYRFREGEKGPSLILAWGGLRGALSLALALRIPAVAERPVILSMTYAVVIFAVAVQGLTFDKLTRFVTRTEP